MLWRSARGSSIHWYSGVSVLIYVTILFYVDMSHTQAPLLFHVWFSLCTHTHTHRYRGQRRNRTSCGHCRCSNTQPCTPSSSHWPQHNPTRCTNTNCCCCCVACRDHAAACALYTSKNTHRTTGCVAYAALHGAHQPQGVWLSVCV